MYFFLALSNLETTTNSKDNFIFSSIKNKFWISPAKQAYLLKRPDSKIISSRDQKIFKGTMVSEKSQPQKVTYCLIPLIWHA